MKAALVVAALLLGAAVCSADDPTGSITGVVDLTPENFDKYVNGGKHALVEFYAPWCGHCKRMVPELKKLGEAISKDSTLSSRVLIAKVDADKHRSLGERFGIQGFPTIKYFGRGKGASEPESYEEGRTSERFLAFLAKKIQDDGSFARVDALDTFAEQFLGATDKGEVVAAVEKALRKLSGEDAENGQIYVDVMKKAIAKGDEYFQKEKSRVERVLSSGGIHASKAELLAKKASVLTAFVQE